MREVIMRRYSRLLKEKTPLPDLILIDGGKGQLSMGVSALRELGIAYVSIVGLAKRLEEVFLPGQSEPQSISKSSAGLLMLRKIRDEAHRFAVTFQRQKRVKSIMNSPFLMIRGMGPKRVKKMWATYHDLKMISQENTKEFSDKCSIPEEISAQCIETAKELVNCKNI